MSSNCSASHLEIPKLSILLSTKDQAATLERCLQGILFQTFKDYELIILNDGSTDSTSQILERFKCFDPRIRLFSHATAQGVIPAYQKLQQLARGEFIWHAASDDFCVDKYFLTKGFRLLAATPQAAGFFCNTLRVMMPATKPHGIWGTTGKARYIPPETFLSHFLLGKIVIPGCATVVRRTSFLDLGGFSLEAGPLCDLLINAKLGSSLGMAFTGTTSIHSSVYAAKNNFGSSFNPWQQLQHLVYLEFVFRRFFSFRIEDAKELWNHFRYLYLGKFFNLEHQFRLAKKNPPDKLILQNLATSILEEYIKTLARYGMTSEKEMQCSDFLSFPFRKPYKRFLSRIQKSCLHSPSIEL